MATEWRLQSEKELETEEGTKNVVLGGLQKQCEQCKRYLLVYLQRSRQAPRGRGTVKNGRPFDWPG